MKRGRKKGFKLTEEQKRSMKRNRDIITHKNVKALKEFIIENYGLQTLDLVRKPQTGKKDTKLYIQVLKKLASLGYTYNEIGLVIGKTREDVGYICKNK